MSAQDIGWAGLACAYGALFVSLVLFRLVRVSVYRDLLVSVIRMSVQLAMVGFYLTILFEWNNPIMNLGWVLLMTAVATFSLLKGSGLKLSLFWFIFPAMLITVSAVLAWFVGLVFRPEPLLDARYIIPVAGMILGNSMNRTIITMERFYSGIRQDHEGYASFIAMGAGVREASAPYISTAYRVGLAPQLASMAVIGLVFLPGMMTGQILGGSSPMTAIKYQIAIIIAIFVATELASYLSIRLSMRRGFDEFGFLRDDIFKTRRTEA